MKLLNCFSFFRYMLAASGLLTGFTVHAQQSFTNTQYMNNLTPYNPAYSLINGQGNLNLLGRRQWAGIEGAPTSYILNGNLALKNIQASAGLVALQDKFGVEDQKEITAFFAKAITLSESTFLAASLNGGFQSYKATYSMLDSSDPQFQDDINENTGTIGAGLMLFNPEKFYVSASVPRVSIQSLGKGSVGQARNWKNTYYFAAGYLASGEEFSIKPATLIAYSANLPVLVDISTTVYFKNRFGLGINYRSTKEISGILSTWIGNNFSLGYSYQAAMGNSNISTFQTATHEISLGFRFGDLDKINLL